MVQVVREKIFLDLLLELEASEFDDLENDEQVAVKPVFASC